MNFSKTKRVMREAAAIGKRSGRPGPNIMVMKMIFIMLEYL